MNTKLIKKIKNIFFYTLLTVFTLITSCTQETKELQYLYVTQTPDKTSYYAGEKLDLTGLVVEAVFSDNSTETISNYTTDISTETTLEEGNKTVTITYLDKKTSFNIEVKAVSLEKLYVTQTPDKTSYYVGEKIDLTGLVVEAVFSDNSTKIISDYTTDTSAESPLEAGKKAVTITYLEKTTSFNIVVESITPKKLYLASIPKAAYYKGEKLDLTNLKIEQLMTNNSSEAVSEYTAEPADGTELNTTGVQTITITSENLTCTFNIQVYDTKISKLYITKAPDKISYYEGESLDLTGLGVEATFSDNSTETISNYTTDISTETPLEAGKKTITISYLDKTTSFDIDVKEAISKFVTQLTDKTFEIYKDNQKLNIDVITDFDASIIFSWYRKTNGEPDFKIIKTTQANSIKSGEILNNTFTIPQNNYLKATYFCKATLNTETFSKSIESDTCNVIQTVSTGLPVLKINTNDGNAITSKDDYVTASFNLLSDNSTDNLSFDEIKIKGRGNSSWTQPKKPYTIKLDKKTNVLGMKKSKKWVLVANYSDKTLLRNDYVSYLGNNIFTNMEWNPSFKSIDFVLNDEYMGTYLIGEQIKIEENRLNIQNVADTVIGKGNDVNADCIVDEKDGGFIFEVNTTRMDEAYNYRTTKGIGMSLKDPDVEDFADNEEKVETYMAGIIQTAENVLYSDNWLDSENGYTKYIDVDSFIDWWFVNEITKNNDACWFSSVYLYYKPDEQKLYMGPDWDFDISCGNINYNGCDNYEGFWIKSAGWHKRLFSDPDFVNKVKARWAEIKDNLKTSLNSTIQDKADYISQSAELNFKRWSILGTYVWPNASDYANRTTYQSEVDYMITWLNNRYNWLDSAINDL